MCQGASDAPAGIHFFVKIGKGIHSSVNVTSNKSCFASCCKRYLAVRNFASKWESCAWRDSQAESCQDVGNWELLFLGTSFPGKNITMILPGTKIRWAKILLECHQFQTRSWQDPARMLVLACVLREFFAKMENKRQFN